MIVLGVDPGSPGKTGGTGLVVVDSVAVRRQTWSGGTCTDRGGLLAHEVVQARDVDLMERAGIVYLEAQHDLADRLDRLAAQARPATIDLVAIEDINSPGGHARGRGGHLINPRYLLAAAVQAGVAIQWAHAAGLDVVIVPPAGNGGAPADAYPAALRGAKTGKARHARSAFDVALGGAALARWTP